MEAVEDGLRGLASMADRKFDLLITDIFMPELDGIGVLREIRKKHLNMKVICMSGGGRGVMPREALDVTEIIGATKTISKPFTRIEILPIVRELIGSSLPAE